MSLIKGNNVVIKEGVIIGENVVIEDNVYIDYGCIIRDNVHIKKNTFIGARSILGEYLFDFYKERKSINSEKLIIGENGLIRSDNVIYSGTVIGDNFQSGHKVTIREFSEIGNNVSVGTLSDIQGKCKIGNYVRLHSNVHIGQASTIEDYVWIFPYVILTNDPTPPSELINGVTVKSFAVIAAGSIILPGVTVEGDSLVAAGAVVTKDVKKYNLVGGNPAKVIGDVRNVKNRLTGKQVYPWRYTFKRGMPWQDSDFEKWMITQNK